MTQEKQRRNMQRNATIRLLVNNCLAQHGWTAQSKEALLDYINAHHRFSDLMIRSHSERADQLRYLTLVLGTYKQKVCHILSGYKGIGAQQQKRIYGYDPITDVWFSIPGMIIAGKTTDLAKHFEHAVKYNLEPHKRGTGNTVEWYGVLLDLIDQGYQAIAPEISQPALFVA